MAVFGHVQHAQERNAPRVAAGRAFAEEHGHALVDGARQVGIGAGAEDRAGAGVGVEQGEVGGGEGEAAARIAQVLGAGEEEGELAARYGFAAQRQQAELHAAVHCGEQAVAVFEVEQGGELAALVEVGEEVLAGGVGGDACGHDEAGAALGGEQAADGLGEDGVGVDVARASKRVAAAVAEELAGGFGGVAMRGSRAAKISCSWSLMRSQGGLLNTTSKPGESATKTSGNSSGQWKKNRRCARVSAVACSRASIGLPLR